MLRQGKLKCIVPGGISTKVLTAAEVEPLTFDHQSLTAAGSGVGSGGMIAIAEGTCMVRLLQVMLRFYHHESAASARHAAKAWAGCTGSSTASSRGRARQDDIDQLIRISSATTARRSAAWATPPATRRRHPGQVPRRVRLLDRAQALALDGRQPGGLAHA
jgi:NADH:ubiquinone oxidoreductase subunit F (NADH-binding)